ncbi:MAG: hypothetical protein M3496_10075, partial [Pseudomonadota bacterium]|nr:hypothetical protein [Pseudomonadota bacterium]
MIGDPRTGVPLALTRLLAALSALILIASVHAQSPGEVGSVVQWRDVTLLDGRTLKASELHSGAVVVQI